jgi:sulfur carrier protein
MVTVEVVGEGTREIEPETLGADPTYADLVRAVDYSPHEVSVLVDDQPVPEDRAVDAEHVRILRLIKGG